MITFDDIHDAWVLDCDVVVNSANTGLKMTETGVCAGIFKAAGEKKLAEECRVLAPCPVGDVVVTNAYDLPARLIFHAVGPVWMGGRKGDSALLMNCYHRALDLVLEYKCRSIAFPLISVDHNGFPVDSAFRTSMFAILSYMFAKQVFDEIDVIMMVTSHRELVSQGQRILKNIPAFADDYLRWLSLVTH